MRSPAAAAACAALALAVCTLAGCTSTHSAPPSTAAASKPSTSTRSGTSTPVGTTSPSPGPADWPTYHGDFARSGVSASMPAVSGVPRLVRALALDAAMYASPIVGASTIFAATENDSVYAFDANGTQKWRTTLGRPSPASERPCGDIDPLGITGTPVYDSASRTVYVAPEYGAPVRHELVALDAATGAIRWRRSIDLPGADATVMQQRGALAITGGRVWVPFGGLAGDCGAYKGRVVGVPLDGAGEVLAYTVPTMREAGIWTPPGPAVDGSGDLFLAVGNGASASSGHYDFSDSVLRVSPATTKLLDSFSPANWNTDNAGDLDLGSQGVAFVGPWVFIAGKSSTAYVLRKDHLGGIGGQMSATQLCASYGGTAVVGDVVYVPCNDGDRAVRVDSSGRLQVLWHAGGVAGSPVVGGGRVWSLAPKDGVLHALDPRTGRSTASVQVGVTTRFAAPALFGNLVLVPTVRGLAFVSTS
jgi:hypothetical protein